MSIGGIGSGYKGKRSHHGIIFHAYIAVAACDISAHLVFRGVALWPLRFIAVSAHKDPRSIERCHDLRQIGLGGFANLHSSPNVPTGYARCAHAPKQLQTPPIVLKDAR